MSRRKTLALLMRLMVACTASLALADKPNIIVIFTDDQGYADVGIQGQPGLPGGPLVGEEAQWFSHYLGVDTEVCP